MAQPVRPPSLRTDPRRGGTADLVRTGNEVDTGALIRPEEARMWFDDADPARRCPAALAVELAARGLTHGRPASGAEPGIVFVGPGTAGAGTLTATTGGRVLAVLLPGAAADAWSLLASGIGDVIALADFDPEDAIARLQRWDEIDRTVASATVSRSAVGTSPCWIATLREVVEAARFTSTPILLVGETGTGKDVIAHLVHDLDRRPRSDLVVLDCGSVVPTLAGSEFFGHERGAFTGAVSARAGAFELAHRGTLFLDEIGELPVDLQAALLRVVQEGTYKRVGGTQWFETKFRLVAATNRDLGAAQNDGSFRRDLYHRLAATVIRLPTLADRRDDIIALFSRFAEGSGAVRLTADVRTLLVTREYPGNIRDLRQLALRVAARHVGSGPITVGDVPPADRPPSAGAVIGTIPSRTRTVPDQPTGPDSADRPPGDPQDPGPVDWTSTLRRAIRDALAEGRGLKELKDLVPTIAMQVAMEQTGGATAAARLLGISRRAVEYRTANAARQVADAPL